MSIFSEIGEVISLAKELESVWGDVKPLLSEISSAKTSITNVVNDLKDLKVGATLSKSVSETPVRREPANTLLPVQDASTTVLAPNTEQSEAGGSVFSDIPSNPEMES